MEKPSSSNEDEIHEILGRIQVNLHFIPENCRWIVKHVCDNLVKLENPKPLSSIQPVLTSVEARSFRSGKKRFVTNDDGTTSISFNKTLRIIAVWTGQNTTRDLQTERFRIAMNELKRLGPVDHETATLEDYDVVVRLELNKSKELETRVTIELSIRVDLPRTPEEKTTLLKEKRKRSDHEEEVVEADDEELMTKKRKTVTEKPDASILSRITQFALRSTVPW